MIPNFQKKKDVQEEQLLQVFLFIYYCFFLSKNNLIGKEVCEIAGFVDSELVIESGELRCVWILWR